MHRGESRGVVFGVALASLATACSANTGRSSAPAPTPSPRPAATVPAAPQEAPPAAPATFEFRLDPRGKLGNVVLKGNGCVGEGATVDLFAYAEDGTEVPIVGGPPGADGTWELLVALRAGRYRVVPKCYVGAHMLLVAYEPRELKVP